MSNTVPYELVKLKVKDHFSITVGNIVYSSENGNYLSTQGIINNMLTGVFNNDKVHLFAYKKGFPGYRIVDALQISDELKANHLLVRKWGGWFEDDPNIVFGSPESDAIAEKIVNYTKKILVDCYSITYNNDAESLELLRKLEEIKRTYKDVPLKQLSERSKETIVQRVLTRIGILLTNEWEFFYGIDKNTDVRDLLESGLSDVPNPEDRDHLSQDDGFFYGFCYPNNVVASDRSYSNNDLKTRTYPDVISHSYPDKFPRSNRESLALASGLYINNKGDKKNKKISDVILSTINKITEGYVYNSLLKLPDDRLTRDTPEIDLKKLIINDYDTILEGNERKGPVNFPYAIIDITTANIDYGAYQPKNTSQNSFDFNTYYYLLNLSQRLHVANIKNSNYRDGPFKQTLTVANKTALEPEGTISKTLAVSDITEIDYKEVLALWSVIPYEYKKGLYESSEDSYLKRNSSNKIINYHPVYKYIIEKGSQDYGKLVKTFKRSSSDDFYHNGLFRKDMLRMENGPSNIIADIITKTDILLVLPANNYHKDIKSSGTITRFKSEWDRIDYVKKRALLKFIFSCIHHVASAPSEIDMKGLAILVTIDEESKAGTISNYTAFYKSVEKKILKGLSLTQIRELGKRVLDIKHNESPFADKDKRLEFINNAIDPYTIALTATGVLKMNLDPEDDDVDKTKKLKELEKKYNELSVKINQVHGNARKERLREELLGSYNFEKEKVNNPSVSEPQYPSFNLFDTLLDDEIARNDKYDEYNDLYKKLVKNLLPNASLDTIHNDESRILPDAFYNHVNNSYNQGGNLLNDLKNISRPSSFPSQGEDATDILRMALSDIDSIEGLSNKLNSFSLPNNNVTYRPNLISIEDFKNHAKKIARLSTLSKDQVSEIIRDIDRVTLTTRGHNTLYMAVYGLVRPLDKDPYTHQNDFTDIKAKLDRVSNERTLKTELNRLYNELYTATGAKQVDKSTAEIKELVNALKSKLDKALEYETLFQDVKALMNDVRNKHAIYNELSNSINSANKATLENYKNRLLAAKRDTDAIDNLNTKLTELNLPSRDRASHSPLTPLSNFKELAKRGVNKSNISENDYDAKIRAINEANNYTDVVNLVNDLQAEDDIRNTNYNSIKTSLDNIPSTNANKEELTRLFNELYDSNGPKASLSATTPVFTINSKVNTLKSRIEEVEEEIRNTPTELETKYNELNTKIDNQVLSDLRKAYLKAELKRIYDGEREANPNSTSGTILNDIESKINKFIEQNPKFRKVNDLFKTMVNNQGSLDDINTLSTNPDFAYLARSNSTPLSNGVNNFSVYSQDNQFEDLARHIQNRIDINNAVEELNTKLRENSITPLVSHTPTLTPIEDFRAAAIKVLNLMEVDSEDYNSKVDTINQSTSYKDIVNELDGLVKASDKRPNYFAEIKNTLANIPLTDLRRQDLVNRYNELYDSNGPKSTTLPLNQINNKVESLINEIRQVNNDLESRKLEQIKESIQNKIDQLSPVKRRTYVNAQYNTLKQRNNASRTDYEEFNDKVDDLLQVVNEYKAVLNNNTVPEFDAYASANVGKPSQNWTRGLVSFEGNANYNEPYTESHANIDTDINRLNSGLGNTVTIIQKANALKRYVNEILNNNDIVKLAKKEAGYVFNGEADNVGTKPSPDTKTYLEKALPAIASETSIENINTFVDNLLQRYERYNSDLQKRNDITAKLPTIRDLNAKERFEREYNDIYNWKFSDKEDGNTIRLSSGINSIDMPENKVFTYDKVSSDLSALLARINEEVRLQDTKPSLNEQIKQDTIAAIEQLVPDNRRQFYRNEYNRIINDRYSTDNTLESLKANAIQAKAYIDDITTLLREQVSPNLLKYSVLNKNKEENSWERGYPAYNKTQDFYNRLALNKLPANTVLADIEKLRVLKSEVIGKNNTADALKHFTNTILGNTELVRTVNKESGWVYTSDNDLVGTPPSVNKDTLLDAVAKVLVTLDDPTQIYNRISDVSDKFSQYKKQQGLRNTIVTELAKLRKDEVKNPLTQEYNRIRNWKLSEPVEGGVSIADNQSYPEYNIIEINNQLEDLIQRIGEALDNQRREEAIEDALRRRRQELFDLLDRSGIKQNDPQYNVIFNEINQAATNEQLDAAMNRLRTVNDMYNKHASLSNQIRYIEGEERQRHHQDKINNLKANLVTPVTDARWVDAEAKITEAINANNIYNQIKDLINELGSADVIVIEETPNIPAAGRDELSRIKERLLARKNYLKAKEDAEGAITAINTGDNDKDNRFKRDARDKLADINNGNHDLLDYTDRMRKLRDLRQEIQDYINTRQVEEDRINATKRNIETRIGFVLGNERRTPLETRLNELKAQPIFVESDWQALSDKTTDKINSNGVYTEIEKLIAEIGEGHPAVIESRPLIANATHPELIDIRTKLHGIAIINRKKEFLQLLNRRVNDILIRGEFAKRIDAAESMQDLLTIEAEIQNEIQLNFLRKETKAAIDELPTSENLRSLLDTEERQAKTREALIDIRNRALRRKNELDIIDARKPKKPRTPLTPVKPPSVPKLKQYHYDLDPTGREKKNLILNERHTITVENRTPQNVLIPGFAPFFRRSLIVRDMASGHELIEGIDYLVVWPIDVTPDTEDYTPLYGGIQFIDEELTGQFEIDYQTIGGQFALDGVEIAQALANQANDPLKTTFESLIGRPIKLPPLEHVHGIEDFVGFNDLTNSVLSLRDAIELLAREDAENHPGYDTLIDAYFNLKTQLDLYKTTMSGFDNKLTDELNRLETHLNDSIGNARTELTNNFETLREGLTDDITQLRRDVNNQINQFQSTIDQSLNAFKIEVRGNVNTLTERLTTEVNGLSQSINTARDDLTAKITKVNNDLTRVFNEYRNTNDEAVRALGERVTTLSNDLGNRVRTLENKPANRITDNNGKLSYNGKDYLNSDDLAEINRNIQNAINSGADWNTNLRNIPNNIHYYSNKWVKTTSTDSATSGLEVLFGNSSYKAEVNRQTKNWKLYRSANPAGGTLETDREQHIHFPPTPGEQHVVYRTELTREISGLRNELNGISNVVGGSLQSVLNSINTKLQDLERRVRVNEEFRESITFEF